MDWLVNRSFDEHVWHAFLLLCVVCAGVQLATWRAEAVTTTAPFRAFQRGWLAVYLLAMAADWMQGPYVYALYDHYGFAKEQIAHLFIAGFGSSMLVGTVVGALADQHGRRRLSIAYAVIYALACVTKLYNNFALLLLGRVLAGVATSLLFSAFEAWMVSEHRARGFAPAWLSQTFAYATLGNGVVAIGAGLAASQVADAFGFVAPFMAALGILVVCGTAVAASWNENYGDERIDLMGGLSNAVVALQSDTRIPLLGLVQSLFEGSMYTFVFMWTPALESAVGPDAATLPFGQIFACFMVAIMIGSGLFGALINRFSPEAIAIGNFVVAAATLLAASLSSASPVAMLASFLVFEICCGVYFPCQGTLRSKYIPEDCRSAIMNFFRIPLNLLVVVVLVKVGSLENHTVFHIIVSWLVGAFALQCLIFKRRHETDSEEKASAQQ